MVTRGTCVRLANTWNSQRSSTFHRRRHPLDIGHRMHLSFAQLCSSATSTSRAIGFYGHNHYDLISIIKVCHVLLPSGENSLTGYNVDHRSWWLFLYSTTNQTHSMNKCEIETHPYTQMHIIQRLPPTT